jgi:UDP:flavonoid glycosyltransferase YjiC (YdhE family)
MARLLAYHSPAPGQVYPTVAMLLELRRRGHDVHVRTSASEVERLGALGLHTARVDPRIEAIEIDDWRGRSQVDSLRRLVRAFAARAQLELPDLREAIGEIGPDVLIVDNGCEGAMYAAEASGLPWVMYCPYPPPFRSVDAPPHGFGFVPARGPLGLLRDRIARRVGDGSSLPSCAR